MAHITDVLKKPILTEKSLRLMDEENKYTFDVDVRCNQVEIKEAVEKLFNVKVEKVNVMNIVLRHKELVVTKGRLTEERKLSFKLAEGNKIDLFG